MIRREEGFTLVELLITMVIFVLVIASASVVFTGLLTQFKQQSKIAETNIEGVVGLEILRQDVERAGYGLPWNILIQPSTAGDWATLVNYNEAASAGSPNPADFNDGSPASALPAPANITRAPRAIVSDDNAGLNNSDYLVIKSVSIARNFAAGKWQLLHTGAGSNMKTWWAEVNEYVCRNDRGDHYPNVRVIVISPGATFTNSRSLVVNSANSFFSPADDYTILAGFQPTVSAAENRIMYGVDPDTNLRVPFNRADYYIRQPATMPGRCAPGTGILYKATMNHADGSFTEMPLLDCVADMQVTFVLDTDVDGTVDSLADDITALTAEQIRDQLQEIRVYVVAHEGQRDTGYDFSQPGARIRLSVLEISDTLSRTLDFADLSTEIGNPEYKFYRWKLYTMTVKPDNLR